MRTQLSEQAAVSAATMPVMITSRPTGTQAPQSRTAQKAVWLPFLVCLVCLCGPTGDVTLSHICQACLVAKMGRFNCMWAAAHYGQGGVLRLQCLSWCMRIVMLMLQACHGTCIRMLRPVQPGESTISNKFDDVPQFLQCAHVTYSASHHVGGCDRGPDCNPHGACGQRPGLQGGGALSQGFHGCTGHAGGQTCPATKVT